MAVTRIDELMDYGSATVQAKVIFKSEMRQTRNGKNFFNFILDDTTCDIKCSVFQDADKFFPLFSQNDWVRMSGMSVQLVTEQNKRFNKCKSEYEIYVRPETQIERITAPSSEMKMQVDQLHLLTEQLGEGDSTSGNLVLYTTASAQMKTSRDPQKNWLNITVQCFDRQGTEARVTFWERDLKTHFQMENVTEDDTKRFQQIVLGITKAQVRKQERYGISIGLNSYSQVFNQAQIPSAFADGQSYVAFLDDPLYQQFQKQQRQLTAASPDQGASRRFGTRGTMGDLQSGESIRCLVSLLLLPNADTATYDGCIRCRKHTCDCNAGTRKYYRVRASIADWAGSAQVTLFDQQGEQLFGMSADQLDQLDPAEKQRTLSQFLTAEVVVRQQPPVGDQREQNRIQTLNLEPNWKEWLGYELERLSGGVAGALE